MKERTDFDERSNEIELC